MKIEYDVTSTTYGAKKVLENLPDTFSVDFEVASKYTESDKLFFKNKLETYNLSREEKRLLKQAINSNGLSHPSMIEVMCVSLGESSSKAHIITFQNDYTRTLVFNYLITTNKQQIYHNSCYDLGLLWYYTKSTPKKWVDTQLLSKCFLNNVDNSKSLTNLKHLQGANYGDWGLSKDDFKKEEMNKEYFLRYTAIDACATYKLFEELLEYMRNERNPY